MDFTFSKNKENFLKLIVNCAKAQNIRIFFVGGIVRDYLLKKSIKDIDLIIEGNAIEFSKNLPSEIKIKSIHEDFKTVKVEYNNEIIDIASTRIEKYPYSGCLPVVEKIGVSIEQDFKRRDFAINAMYAELNLTDDELSYKLIDLANGQKALKEKVLNVLHKKSYIDDPTRILRGLDFKYRFNFDFSSTDKELIQNYIDNPNLENASKNRILNVFKKILSSDNNDLIFKEIVKNKYYKILGTKNLKVDFDLIKNILEKFQLKSKKDFYLDIISNSPFEKHFNMNDFEIYKHFSQFNIEKLAYFFYKTQDENIEKFLKIKDIKLFLKGKDIINLGFQQGKQIGIILDELLKEKIQNKKIKTKIDEINWVKNSFH